MTLPIVLLTGQLLTDAVWQPLLDAWPDREVIVADNRSDDTIGGFAQRLLDNAPPKFVLVAHAMGGFVAFEVMRRAPERSSEERRVGKGRVSTCRSRLAPYPRKQQT